jgi:hypothetical protein
MMTDPQLPPNMRDFNEITALILGQLYTSFPIPMKLDEDALASALGLQNRHAPMSSERPFDHLLSHTVQWLTNEDFIRSLHPIPLARLVLTAKGMAAMNVVPPSLSRPLGSELAEATEQASTEGGKRKIAELMGNFFGSAIGSLTKSISGG